MVPEPRTVVETDAVWEIGYETTISTPRGLTWKVSRWEMSQMVDDLVDDLIRRREACRFHTGPTPGGEIRLSLGGDAPDHPEGYRLVMDETGVTIDGADMAGLQHGMQTLSQLVAFAPATDRLSGVEITDWPQYPWRAVMVDMGRAPFSLPLLKRVVRVMARLKLNVLHLHLHDNELNGVRYAHLPLGSKNPAALTIAEYAELIQYATRYHVQVVPELEAWGHVDSLLYHYPELSGTLGRFGRSFGMGEPTYDLLERMFAEWVPILAGDPLLVHVGLDEADWSLLESVPVEKRATYTPVTHVRRLHEMLTRLAAAEGKGLEMHLWADHGGRPLPKGIEGVVIEPWQYHIASAEDIKAKVIQYGSDPQLPFVMGAGASVVHDQGAFAATQLWCRQAQDVTNCRGVTICLWGANDVAARLVSVFAGTDAAWTPDTPTDPERDPRDERLRGDLVRRMRYWQACFPDVSDEALDADRGPGVVMGRYADADRLGQLVAPTAGWEGDEV